MSAIPSQEQLLQLLGNSDVQDSRTLWHSDHAKPNSDDAKEVDEYFRKRAEWQLSLQGVLNSLKSREVRHRSVTILTELTVCVRKDGLV